MPETETFLNPERIVETFEIPKGGVAADFGAGSGFYTMALARRVGPEGKVYAFDIQASMADLIRSNARLRHLLQVDAVRADLESERGTRLKDGVCDFILVASILHQAEDKAAILREAARVLKPGRPMAVIEWDEERSSAGPRMEARLPKARARALAESAGFMQDREFSAGSHHYGLLFKRR